MATRELKRQLQQRVSCRHYERATNVMIRVRHSSSG
jgi:hypothetical protein